MDKTSIKRVQNPIQISKPTVISSSSSSSVRRIKSCSQSSITYSHHNNSFDTTLDTISTTHQRPLTSSCSDRWPALVPSPSASWSPEICTPPRSGHGSKFVGHGSKFFGHGSKFVGHQTWSQSFFFLVASVSILSTLLLIPTISAVSCSSSQFECSDGKKCIPLSWKCDDHKDCHDGSDEKFCEARKCTSSEFKCDNGDCIPSSWRCDNVTDCTDGSDESNCKNHLCDLDQFRCSNGQCITMAWKCDGHHDCHDGSDETNTDCTSKACSSEEFKCASGQCIAKTWKCDQEPDCDDGSDEVGCPKVTCSSTEFTCSDGKCIPDRWQCDGSIDCSDGSDEVGCKKIYPVDHHHLPGDTSTDGNHDKIYRNGFSNTTLSSKNTPPSVFPIVTKSDSKATLTQVTLPPTTSLPTSSQPSIDDDRIKTNSVDISHHSFYPEDGVHEAETTSMTPSSNSSHSDYLIPILLAILLITLISIPLVMLFKYFRYKRVKQVKSLNFDNPVYRKTTDTMDQLLSTTDMYQADSLLDPREDHHLATFLSMDMEQYPRHESRNFETRHA